MNAQSEFVTGEGFVSADRDPSSGATRHLLPQGETVREPSFLHIAPQLM
jgi:hypothetical protein